MKGGADMFVENMPGLPDNIRLSSSGGYWVAMSAVRPNPGFSLLDFLSEKPWIKRMIFKVKKKKTKTELKKNHLSDKYLFVLFLPLHRKILKFFFSAMVKTVVVVPI